MKLVFKYVIALCVCLTANASAEPTKDMKLIKGASFNMGSDPAELEAIATAVGLQSTRALQEEIPNHQVSVDVFYMDIFDVTNEQFSQFVGANPDWSKANIEPNNHNGRYLEHWNEATPPRQLLSHPVTFVTWQSADAYCRWKDKRLPTEIEYEWAAQDGMTNSEFPWGNQLPNDELVNWGGNGIETTVDVGSYPPNGRGLYDISGNIWHFTADPWLGSYQAMMDAENLPEITAQIRRVVRGGSFGASAANLRVRYRDSHRPFDAREMVGFRCAMN